MLLEQLAAYAQDHPHILPPPMYQRTLIRHFLVLNQEGKLLSVETHEENGGKPVLAPYLKRTSGIKAALLIGDGEDVLGLPRPESDRARVQRKHRAFIECVKACYEFLKTSGHERPAKIFEAIIRFLEAEIPRDALQDASVHLTARFTFRLFGEDCYPFELPCVQAYWAKTAAADRGGAHMQCLICGQSAPVVSRLPMEIRGIPGGKPGGGLVLISADKPAYESYGLTESRVSPTCALCGERIGNALNSLLRDPTTHLVIASLVYVFWVKGTFLPPVSQLLQGEERGDLRAESAQIQALLSSLWTAEAVQAEVDPSPFYATTLSANGNRVVVRDWIETKAGDIQRNLKRFFRLQCISDTTGQPVYLYLRRLIRAVTNPNTKEPPQAHIGRALMRVALSGGSVDRFVLYLVLQRIRATRNVTIAQAALVKLIVLSVRPDLERGDASMITLDDSCREPAYLCGRLLALLDTIQYRALGHVNATIGDRFFGTALTAPALVLPRLVAGAHKHLAALRRGRGTSGFLDRELNELLDKMRQPFPTHLVPLDQGLFVLGFHHQKVRYMAGQGAPVANTTTVEQTGQENLQEQASQSDDEWQDLPANEFPPDTEGENDDHDPL